MSDATTIPQSYLTTFKDNQRHRLQQGASKFRAAVDEAPYKGEGAMAVDLLGATNARTETDRYDDTPLMIPDHHARWVYPSGKEWGTLITKFDKVREITDPTSNISKSAEMAFGREIDDEIIGAFFGTAKTGKNGADNTIFPDGQKLNVQTGSGDTPADTGLNYEKLVEAAERLSAAEFDWDNDPVFIGVSAKQNTNLLNQVELISSQYNLRPTFKNGGVQIDTFMGIRFIHSERLPKSGNNRLCPFWVKSGMHLGVWDDIDVKGGEHPGKKFNYQLYGKVVVGATRTEEKKVLQIPCKE